MKLCLGCGAAFDGPEWRCARCGWAPALVESRLAFAADLLQAPVGFEARFFEHLPDVEAVSFWFRARDRLLAWALGRYFPGARSFFEVGCGTGYVLAGFRRAFPGLQLSASDPFLAGVAQASRRVPDATVFQMDARRIPFSAEFDVLGAFDVLEHIEDDEAVLAEMFRAARPGGGVLLTVPQHRFLWSAADEYSHHQRRYSRSELLAKVRRAGFRPLRTTSFVSLLLPLMLLSRLKQGRSVEGFDPAGEHRRSRSLDALLGGVMALERAFILRGVSWPMGGSLLVAAARPR